MKLKDRPLEWWKGRKYTYWCRADQNDERKINYTFNHFSLGQGQEIYHFTSEQFADGYRMYQLRNSWVHEIKLIDNEWFVELDYPYYVENPSSAWNAHPANELW